MRHAIGELITCPFCLAQWVATVLVIGTVSLPDTADLVACVCALARTSDYLQFSFDHLKDR